MAASKRVKARLLGSLGVVAWLGMILGSVACSSGGGGSASSHASGRVRPTCGELHGLTCDCSTRYSSIGGETPVSDCDNPGGGGVWECTDELDPDGRATGCSCLGYGCGAGDPPLGACTCKVGGQRSLASLTTCGATSAKMTCCVDASTSTCTCLRAVAGNTCGNWVYSTLYGLQYTAFLGEPVDHCDSTPGSWYQPSAHTSTSCAGLDWAPPPAPPASGSSSGSSSGGPVNACAAGCGGCSRCDPTYGCVYCPVGDLGVCTC